MDASSQIETALLFRGNVNFYERHRDRMCFIRVLSLLVRLINEKLQPQCWVELLSWAVCVEFTRVLERDLDRSGVVSPPSLPACCMFAAEPEVCSCAVSWKIKRFQHLLRVNSCDYAVGLFYFFFTIFSILARRWEPLFHASELWSGCNVSCRLWSLFKMWTVNNRALSNICSFSEAGTTTTLWSDLVQASPFVTFLLLSLHAWLSSVFLLSARQIFINLNIVTTGWFCD